MKKLVSVLLTAALAFSAVSCAPSASTATPAPTPAPTAAATPAPTAATPSATPAAPAAKAFKVGMVTDVGGVNDQSFNQSAWEGLQKLKAEGGYDISYQESQQEANFGPNLDKMVDAKNDLIWGIGFMMADSVLNAAKTNPDQKYAIIDNSWDADKTPANLTGVMFKAQEPSFLVGYMAGKTTKTGKVGFVGGIKGFIIDQFEFGYRAGVALAAKELGKKITVDVQYAESFADDAKGKAIATTMYTNGCDIVFHAAGNVGQGVIEAAKEQKKLVIGVDRDQSSLAPENVMTSALKLVGSAMYSTSKRMNAGENLGGQTIWYGVKEGACGIPAYEPNTSKLVEKAVYDATIAKQADIVSGKIVVPSNEAEFNKYVETLK